MTQDWDELSNNALVASPQYAQTPAIPLEDIAFKDFAVLDGASDVMPFHDKLLSELIAEGYDPVHAGMFSFVVIEAIQNAQEHAYNWQKYDGEGNLNAVRVGGIFTPKYDIIGVSSKGSIDIDKIRKLLSENEKVRHDNRGRGFFSMTKICDIVYPHQDNGNLEIMLIMMKNKMA